MASISAFSTKGLNFYFQSVRAKIDGKAVSQLVKFIQGAKHSLDVAIYDMKNADVLKALKGMSTKVQLHILYDAGKAGGNSTTVDPKVSTTAQAIKAAGLKVVMKNKTTDPKFWFAAGDPRFVAANSHAFNGTGDKNDFMHNKVMIIDDKVVITGSYNF